LIFTKKIHILSLLYKSDISDVLILTK